MKEVYPESFRSKCSHMFLIREETEATVEKVMWRWRQRLGWCDLPPRNAGNHQKLKEERNWISRETLEGQQVCPQPWSQTSDLRCYKKIHFHCFWTSCFWKRKQKKGRVESPCIKKREICSIFACLRDKIRNLTKHWVESRERKGQRREEERGKNN